MSTSETHSGNPPELAAGDAASRSSGLLWSERFQLAALPPDTLVRIGLFAVAATLVFIAYHFLGNISDVNSYGRSAIGWMISRWKSDPSYGGDYSHGYLIPPVSIAIVATVLRERILAAPKNPSRLGLGLVILALAFHYYGTKSQFAHISVLSLVLLIWAVPFHLFGWQVAKLVIFPCSFLFFCVPLHFLDQLTFPLKMFATSGATHVLQALGIRVFQNGANITFFDEPNMFYSVEDACSGLRSLLALTAIAAVYAYLTQRTVVRKWLLFVASIPIAIVGNVVRITTVVVVDQGFSRKLAGGLYHDYSTYFLFVISISLLVGVGGLLNSNPREWVKKWKSIVSNPT